MIFLSQEKNKVTILVILVTLFSVMVIVAWFKAKPFQSNSSTVNNEEWSNIVNQSVDSWGKVQDNFEFTKIKTEELGDELEKKVEQDELINKTKEYLENKNASAE